MLQKGFGSDEYDDHIQDHFAQKAARTIMITSILHGSWTGAVAGLLLAPASGKETRENLSEKAGELKDDLDKKFNEISQRLKELDGESLGDFKERFHEVKESVKERYEQMAKKVKDLEKDL